MAKNASDVLNKLKPLQAKLPKKVAPFLQKDWDILYAAAKETVDALQKAADSSETKARADLATKLREIATLKTTINDGVKSAKWEIGRARTAQASMLKVANSLGQAIKDKKDDAGAKEVGRAIGAYANVAVGEFSGLESPELLP